MFLVSIYGNETLREKFIGYGFLTGFFGLLNEGAV